MVDLWPSITSGSAIRWSFTGTCITRMRPRMTNWRPPPPVLPDGWPGHFGHPATFKSERRGASVNPDIRGHPVPPDAFNPFNPFNQIISGGSRARLLEFGNRLFDNTTDSFLVTLGARGDKLFDGTWGYDFGFRYSQVKATEHDTLVSTSRFNQILNQNDPIFQAGGVLEGEPCLQSLRRCAGGQHSSQRGYDRLRNRASE